MVEIIKLDHVDKISNKKPDAAFRGNRPVFP